MEWWKDIPWRLIQTNLRQIDMEDIDAERFTADLKEFGATVVLLNTAGIIASYPTKAPFHFQSEFLHGDSLKKIIDCCHREGIRVIARTDFSKVRRPLYEQHPEWAFRTASGDIVDYNGDVHVCLNGDYQQHYLFDIVDEAIRETGVDGIFCNMGGFQTKDYSYNEYGICHCNTCKTLFKARFGMELPAQKEDVDSTVWQNYRVFQRECVQKHSKKLYDHLKEIDSELAVNGFDIERLESNTEYKRALPHWQYSASCNVRKIRGTGESGIVISNATVDFIGFFYRQVAVSPQLQELRLWQNVANLAGLDYYLIGRLDNHRDKSGFEAVKKVFSFHKEHEQLFKGLKPRAQVLLLREGPSTTPEEHGWIRALTETHILFDEARVSQVGADALARYKAVILPDLIVLPKELAERLDAYAQNGGIVVSTGRSAMRDGDYRPYQKPLLECLGVEKTSYVRNDMVSALLEVSEQDVPLKNQLGETGLIAIGDQFAFNEFKPSVEKWFRLVPPHRIGPPERCYYTQVTDIPGLTRYSWGKGCGICIPWLPGKLFCEGGYENSLLFLRAVLLELCGLDNLAPQLTPMVEVTVAEKDSTVVVQLVNGSGHFGTSFYEPLPIRNVQCRIKTNALPKSVESLYLKNNASCVREGEYLLIKIAELNVYEAVVLTL